MSVTCPGGVAWVECAAQCVGGWVGWGGGGAQVCGVGVLCIGATGGRVGGTGVRVWRAPVGAGGGAGEETEAERHRQAKDNTVSNPGLPHCGQILYHLSHQGRPRILEWVAYPFSRGSSQPRNQIGVSFIADRFFTS